MKKRVLKFRAWHKDIKHMFYAQPNGEFIGEVNDIAPGTWYCPDCYAIDDNDVITFKTKQNG